MEPIIVAVVGVATLAAWPLARARQSPRKDADALGVASQTTRAPKCSSGSWA
jgi:hypothetical protein